MNLLAANSAPTAGTCYRFVVDTAEQAATLIRERLGEKARVLSVRSVRGEGWRSLVSSPKLEVIAQIDATAAETAAVAIETTLESPAVVTAPAVSSRIKPELFRSLPDLLRRSGFSEPVLKR